MTDEEVERWMQFDDIVKNRLIFWDHDLLCPFAGFGIYQRSLDRVLLPVREERRWRFARNDVFALVLLLAEFLKDAGNDLATVRI